MPTTRGGITAIAVACLALSGTALAQGKADDGLAVGRQMLAADNPGELWVLRGQKLFYERRGPKQASLEQCDLGLGPGKLEGAFAQLPRYFADTDKVQDLESRLMTCMSTLQGIPEEEIAAKPKRVQHARPRFRHGSARCLRRFKIEWHEDERPGRPLQGARNVQGRRVYLPPP
jgi:hypothetical protein